MLRCIGERECELVPVGIGCDDGSIDDRAVGDLEVRNRLRVDDRRGVLDVVEVRRLAVDDDLQGLSALDQKRADRLELIGGAGVGRYGRRIVGKLSRDAPG